MRGVDGRAGELFSYVDLEKRVPPKHPLRLVRKVVNDVLAALDGDFAKAYAPGGRPSIAPERLLRALLLQAFYTIRSERQLIGSSITICCTAGSSYPSERHRLVWRRLFLKHATLSLALRSTDAG